jgi:hypothetical protein
MRLFARNEKGQPASKVDVRSGSEAAVEANPAACLVYPQERTQGRSLRRSAAGHKRL